MGKISCSLFRLVVAFIIKCRKRIVNDDRGDTKSRTPNDQDAAKEMGRNYFSVSAKNSPVASTAAYREWKSSSLNTLKV